MNIGLFLTFLIADKLNKPVKLKNQKLVRYAIEMNYIQYVVEGYDDNLNPICKEDSYSLEFEGRKALYTFQTQFITWLISIFALIISILAYLKK
mgnify:FL=1|jgi:hypothetical protein|nr:MAG TPA: hypothetical protein [Caudoviricetes sp.]